jgi:hypothetical protein
MRIIVNELVSDNDLGIESYRKVIDISEDQLVRIFNKCSEIRDKEKEPLFEELSTQQPIAKNWTVEHRIKAAALVIRDFCKNTICTTCPFSFDPNSKLRSCCPFCNSTPDKWYEEGDN